MLTTSEIEEMSVDEQFELTRKLWLSIKSKEKWDDSVPEWQREILEERLKYSLEHPEEGRPWKEVMQELRANIKPRS